MREGRSLCSGVQVQVGVRCFFVMVRVGLLNGCCLGQSSKDSNMCVRFFLNSNQVYLQPQITKQSLMVEDSVLVENSPFREL